MLGGGSGIATIDGAERADGGVGKTETAPLALRRPARFRVNLPRFARCIRGAVLFANVGSGACGSGMSNS